MSALPTSPPLLQTYAAYWNVIFDSLFPPLEMFFSFINVKRNAAQCPHINALLYGLMHIPYTRLFSLFQKVEFWQVEKSVQGQNFH